MDRSAVILAQSSQAKFNEDKGLLKLENKPLLNHVVDAIKAIVDEVIIVTCSKAQTDLYAKTISSAKVQFAVDENRSNGSLAGVLTGFEAVQGEYSLVLPFDSPLVSKEVVSLFFDCCVGKSAVIPRSPDRQIEPLHAVYHTKQALAAAKEAHANGEFEIEALVNKLRGVRYLSTLVIEQLDPDFRTFFQIITPLDLKKAVNMAKPAKTKNRK